MICSHSPSLRVIPAAWRGRRRRQQCVGARENAPSRPHGSEALLPPAPAGMTVVVQEVERSTDLSAALLRPGGTRVGEHAVCALSFASGTAVAGGKMCVAREQHTDFVCAPPPRWSALNRPRRSPAVSHQQRGRPAVQGQRAGVAEPRVVPQPIYARSAARTAAL